MTVAIDRVRLWRTELRTRLPFKYGIATMTHLPHVFVELHAQIGGREVRGIAADHLPPKWFTKDPARAVADEIADMERVIAESARRAEGAAAPTVFAAWLALHRAMETWRATAGVPPLLAHFGTSLVERALLDAWCRAAATPFAAAVRSGALGLRLGDIHPELAGADAADLLPAVPLRSVFARHTVGLADPIDAADLTAPVADGLPETLAEAIAAYGLRHFKIKFTGAADLPRLARIFAVIGAAVPTDELRFTLDGNESFATVAAFRAVWAQIEALPGWAERRAGLVCVEQPFHRDTALAPETTAGLLAWAERPPLIIDESDAECDSVRRALAGGYVGTSHKNCKGVFRGIANACLLEQRRRRDPSRALLLTGEDLANIGPVALLQDLAVQATLGVASVERNGHHYFRGLSFFPESVQARLVAEHGDLYRRHPQGFATLALDHGRLAVGSTVDAPFGVATIPDLVALSTPVT